MNKFTLFSLLLIIFMLTGIASGASAIDALCHAVENNDMELIEYTITEYPELINEMNSGGSMPLHYARSKKMAEWLLAKGADVNIKAYNNDTPLHEAVSADSTALAEFYLQKGAKINARGELSQTPLHYAAKKGSIEMIELLLSYGALVNAKDSTGRTPLKIARLFDKKEAGTILRSRGGKE